MNYWSTARRGVLGLSAATIAYSIWKKNPVLPLALYGMHLAEYFIVAKKAGKKVFAHTAYLWQVRNFREPDGKVLPKQKSRRWIL